MTMDKLIADFTKQLREAVDIGEQANIVKPAREIRNIVVTGLGGSGIGGNMASELVEHELTVPFVVNKGYHVPSFVNEHTMVIVSSYSGNTEETLNAFDEAEDRGAYIVCVTSNGKVLERAREKGYPFIQVPGGMPPRACLGYSLVQQFFILQKSGFISGHALEEIGRSIAMLDEQEQTIKEAAKELAEFFHHKRPVLYICDQMASVAVRVRQQINENAKLLCWHHSLPEMNHNELVGWRDQDDSYAVLFIRNKSDFVRNQQRIELNKKIVNQYTENVRELWSAGESLIQEAMYIIHLTDWMSYYLAGLRDHDPVEVNVIDFLKSELAKG